jgi:hypothetical protein
MEHRLMRKNIGTAQKRKTLTEPADEIRTPPRSKIQKTLNPNTIKD